MSHKINHLSFGNQNHINFIKKSFKKGVFTILDNTQKGILGHVEREKHVSSSYNYYLNLVSTEFKDLNGALYQAYQFTSNHLELKTHASYVQFRYDISPIMARFY